MCVSVVDRGVLLTSLHCYNRRADVHPCKYEVLLWSEETYSLPFLPPPPPYYTLFISLVGFGCDDDCTSGVLTRRRQWAWGRNVHGFAIGDRRFCCRIVAMGRRKSASCWSAAKSHHINSRRAAATVNVGVLVAGTRLLYLCCLRQQQQQQCWDSSNSVLASSRSHEEANNGVSAQKEAAWNWDRWI